MATLKGNSIPALSSSSLPRQQPGGRLDHTYVTSEDNYGPWGCFGRSLEGTQFPLAQGNSACADCLSKPSNLLATPPLYAGLRYGVTGVCHQAANRILDLPEYRSPVSKDTELRSFFTVRSEGADGQSGGSVLI